jgi:hypothetical protein
VVKALRKSLSQLAIAGYLLQIDLIKPAAPWEPGIITKSFIPPLHYDGYVAQYSHNAISESG